MKFKLRPQVEANQNWPHEADSKSLTWGLNFNLNFTKFPISKVGVLGSWGRVGAWVGDVWTPLILPFFPEESIQANVIANPTWIPIPGQHSLTTVLAGEGYCKAWHVQVPSSPSKKRTHIIKIRERKIHVLNTCTKPKKKIPRPFHCRLFSLWTLILRM